MRPGTDGWAARLPARRVTAAALAHKTARIAIAVMRSASTYRVPAAGAAAPM